MITAAPKIVRARYAYYVRVANSRRNIHDKISVNRGLDRRTAAHVVIGQYMTEE